MKRPMLLSVCCLLPWVFAACERHSWEETKKLHEHHGDEAGHAEGGVSEAGVSDGGVSEGEHAATDAHKAED